jgi:predicted exporter
MSRWRWLGPGVWLLLLALAALVVARARYSADLSAFLPRAPSASQQLLVQQLRDGLASRLILIGIEGGDAAERAHASNAVVTALRRQPEFVSVSNGEQASQDQDRQFVYRHRYQLSPAVTPARFGVAGLHAAIEDDLQLLASPAANRACGVRPTRRARCWWRRPARSAPTPTRRRRPSD